MPLPPCLSQYFPPLPKYPLSPIAHPGIQDHDRLCGGILVGWETMGFWRGSLVRWDMFHEHFWLGAVPTNKLLFVLKVRTPFNPDNSVISLRLSNRNTMKLPDGAPTHQSIGYNPSSSAWSLAYHLHTQNGLHDRTNKGASFVIEPLSIAYILQPTCARHKIDLSR